MGDTEQDLAECIYNGRSAECLKSSSEVIKGVDERVEIDAVEERSSVE